MSIILSNHVNRLKRAAAIGIVSAAASMALPGLSVAKTPDDMLVVAVNLDSIRTFDPAEINETAAVEITHVVCDNLADFDLNERGKVVPKIAESWKQTDDRLGIVFNIRKDAVFPSGNALTAEDVVYSLKRTIRLNFANSSKLKDLGITAENADEMIVAQDDYSVLVRFNKPYPLPFVLEYLAANRASATIDSKMAQEKAADGDFGNGYFKKKAECVGPYRMADYKPGQSVLLEANENYWGAKPPMRRVLFRHASESSAQRILLEKGDVDLARDLSANDIKELTGKQGVEVSRTITPRMYHWEFNLKDPIFRDARVREAMRYLVDYEGLGKTVMNGIGLPRSSILLLGVLGAPDEAGGLNFSFDPEKAKALLKEAGYENGFEATLSVNTLPFADAVAQNIQANAAKIGVKFNIEKLTQQASLSKLYGRSFQTTLGPWLWAIWDPHGNVSRLMSNADNSDEAKLLGYPAWISSYHSADVNAKVEAAFLEPDSAERARKYQELAGIYDKEGPTAALFQLYTQIAVRDNLDNLKWNAFKIYYNEIGKR